MGTWGPGSYDNDTALDFVGTVDAVDDLRRALDDAALQTGDEIDADLCQAAQAAAELVAGMMGRHVAQSTAEMRALCERLGEPDFKLTEAARNWVSAIASQRSELMALWDEDDGTAFRRELSELIDRLNPALDYASPELQAMGEYLPECGFCGQQIAGKDVFSMTLRNLSSEDTGPKAMLYCHLACLNGALDRDHFIQDWKFDPAEIERMAEEILRKNRSE